MAITTALIKELRDKTGVGMMDCKAALMESDGNIDTAIDYLRKKGIATAKKRGGRATMEGQIESYIHAGGKIGVLVEVNCETDFTAKTEDIKLFARDVAIHIAASNPIAIDKDSLPENVVTREKDIYISQAAESGKPANIIEKMVEGKMKKFYSEVCLLEQAFVKNPDITIQDLLNEMMAKTGEHIVIKQFCRFQVGVSDD